MWADREIRILSKRATGIVAYISLIGFLIAFLCGDREGAKFHLNQALVWYLTELMAGVFFGVIGVIFPFVTYISSICRLVLFVFWIMGLVYAIKEEEKELPLIGGIKILK